MQTKRFFILIIMFFSFISMSSMCKNDEDLDPHEDKRDNIKGTWACQRILDGELDGDYDIEIIKDPEDNTKIIIKKFFNTDADAYAIITGNTITLPSQDLKGYIIEGSATIQDDYQKIEWQYTVDDDGEIMQAAATFTPGTVTKKEAE